MAFPPTNTPVVVNERNIRNLVNEMRNTYLASALFSPNDRCIMVVICFNVREFSPVPKNRYDYSLDGVSSAG